ncbi:MAG: hypothetical protein K0V04_41610 [Deltaproteobacteria bacterium]|nr:hypothetical protein [Deltaproteobacteria bacterium]
MYILDSWFRPFVLSTLVTLPIAACGDDAVPMDSTGSASSSSSSSGSSTASPPSTGAVDSTTGAPSTGGSTTAPNDTTSGDTTTASDTTATDSDSTGNDTDSAACEPLPAQGDSCVVDADCQVAGDCCGCVAFNPTQGGPGNCGGGCGQTVCEQLGVDTAVCDDGVCRVQGLSCDQTAVTCNSPTPDCPDGELPQVQDGCFTGSCLPVEHCDWVPDCAACPQDEVCVITQTDDCDQHACTPPIPKCGPQPTCNCLGSVVCAPPFTNCAVADGAIICS